MTEALHRHLPERPRLRVPQRPRAVVRRPRCRANLGATLKPASLPFEALKAMSENPALFARFLALWPLLLLLAGPVARLAEAATPATPAVPVEVPAAGTVAAATNAAAVSATNAAVVAAPAPAATNVTATSAPASSSSAPTSGRSERSSRRDGGSARAEAAPATNAPPGSWESFRLIAERNIFDQNRSPRAPRASGAGEEPKRAPKIEAFALAGTMSFSNRHMAFFTSASSQYQKALKPGDVIAGYQVAAVATDHVKLEKEGASVELKLNQQMRREDDGPWSVAARAEPVAPPAPAGTAAAPGSGPGPAAPAVGDAPAAPASASEALKRLMELRAKEQ